MTGVPWEEMAGRWKDLYTGQAKVAQGWLDSQAQLASTLVGLGGGDGEEGGVIPDAAAMADLWRSAMSLGTAGLGGPNLEATGVANETIGRMLDPISLSLMGGNRVGEAIRRMTEGPRLADVGSIERGMAQVMELYLEVQTAARSYEGVVAAAWVEVNQRFAGEVSKRFTERGQILPASDALKMWLEIANEILMKSHRSTAFLEAQRQLLRAGMDFLLAERKLVEQLVEPAGLPTRSELDELHHTVHTLKRRVRALEKARDSDGGSSARTTAPRPRRSTTNRGAGGKR